MRQTQVNSICPFCGVGCGIGLVKQDNSIITVQPLRHHPVSQGKLCAKGWNTAFGISRYNRLTQPLMKVDGEFVSVSWQTALTKIATQMRGFITDYGPQSVGVISSARATNEDNYAAQKFARAVLKTNNIDHCARICHSPSVAGLKKTLGSGAMTNSVDDVAKADVILVIGADPTENHAIIGGQIIQAKLAGAKLIVIDPRRTRLSLLADLHLQLNIGSNIALLNGLLNIIFEHNWQNDDFLTRRCEDYTELKAHVAEYTLDKVTKLTGVSGEKLIQAAKLYSQANAAFLAYGMGITQFVSGTNNVIAVSNLVLSCGQIGREGTGINPLRGQNNVQGACDMGCLPNVYPDYQSSTDPKVIDKFSHAWGTPVANQAGLTSLGMSRQARQGKFKGLFIFGEDPVVTDPDRNNVAQGIRDMELVVVIELTMTETAKMADIVLPAASFAEKQGTFTNCERRVQLINQAIDPPGDAKADWQILSLLATEMGQSNTMNWQDSQQIFDEMAQLTDSFSGMSYPLLRQHNGLQWPCNIQSPLGTRCLHADTFPIGKGKLIPVDHVATNETPDTDYPFWFTTMRLHYHYGCGSMTRKSPLLERETPDGLLYMHPQDAQDMGLTNHQAVAVESRRGYLETRLVISEQVVPGLLSMPYHFKEAPSNLLTNDAMDEVTEMPELKACAVRVTALPIGDIPKAYTLDDVVVGAVQ
ncbi:formate dehydrogenase subunit alpha [Aliiglaciecola sp. LCG003]|uniref:formate dehydrogenase subunit alpha n=1 Tax=Aliiglaciecola sp. LCG003 TaxID=3053655 RepID=UPI002573FCAD|nr:formate dehydrogenase subunit alpha [Aliiglaciecola sp. LCG003]WJG07694.1 formate dehydrogenase subunit alpha [Aliiglaciecola sp. LCG003]